MAGVIESINIISNTVNKMLDFLAADETLSRDFEKYLEENGIEIESENEFNNIVIEYMLDMKMENGLRVLEYYRRNSKNHDEVIDALLHSFNGVFKVEKVHSNAFDVKCLTSNAELTLIPMVKMQHLKQIGRYDYIEARALELSGVWYVLEIYDVISEYNPYRATTEAIRCMLLNPKSAYFKNDEKKAQLNRSTAEFYEKFREYFKADFIVTTNKKVDTLIEYFNKFKETGEKLDYESLIEKIENYKYFPIDEFDSDNENFMQNAIGGFSSHKETYDVALWMDKKRGLYIIPFFETFVKCFKENIKDKEYCIKEFLLSDKIPPGVIKYCCEKNDNFFEIVNFVLGTKYSDIEDVLLNTKSVFIQDGIFSPTVVLYNSELFAKFLGFREEEKQKPENIGRNDPCPCGSGKKYKNCCAKLQNSQKG